VLVVLLLLLLLKVLDTALCVVVRVVLDAAFCSCSAESTLTLALWAALAIVADALCAALAIAVLAEGSSWSCRALADALSAALAFFSSSERAAWLRLARPLLAGLGCAGLLFVEPLVGRAPDVSLRKASFVTSLATSTSSLIEPARLSL
jgi:hypothetical protein